MKKLKRTWLKFRAFFRVSTRIRHRGIYLRKGEKRAMELFKSEIEIMQKDYIKSIQVITKLKDKEVEMIERNLESQISRHEKKAILLQNRIDKFDDREIAMARGFDKRVRAEKNRAEQAIIKADEYMQDAERLLAKQLNQDEEVLKALGSRVAKGNEITHLRSELIDESVASATYQ